MPHLSISCLGGFRAVLDGEPVTGFAYDKVRALLAYLAVERERPQRRDHLAGLLWPDYADAAARTNLRNALANLRRVLGDRAREGASPPFLLATRETLRLNPAADWTVDVIAFEQQAREGEATGAVATLVAAAELYRGELLAGFAVGDSVLFEDWAEAERERLRHRAVAVHQRLVGAYEDLGDLPRACKSARRLVTLAPWLEAGHRTLMRLLAQSGQRGAALAQYARCCRALRAELDAEPSTATRDLVEQIRSGDIKTTGPQARPLLQPVSAVQALSFLDSGADRAPAGERQRFVARERELERLGAYLAQALDGKGRLIFVTGEAGQGKTALVQAFAAQAQAARPDLVVADGRCNAYTGVGDPYLPFREILEQLTGDVTVRWAAGSIDRERARRLWQMLPVTARALLVDGPDLVDTFVPGAPLAQRVAWWAQRSAPAEEAQYRRLCDLIEAQAARGGEPLPRQADLFAQVTTVLQRVAYERPLLLLIDDMQWADLGSIGLLFHLVRRLVGNRVLVVGAYRSEEVALGRDGAYEAESTSHPLAPLIHECRRLWGEITVDVGRAEAARFVNAFLDAEPHTLDADFRRTLTHRTGGHPLFTIELLRGMQTRGEIVRDEKGRWQASGAIDWEKLPARVEAAIGARVGRLDRRLQRILYVASVEGETFTAEVIAEVLDAMPSAIVSLLSRILERRYYLVWTEGLRLVDGQRLSQYRFTHILFQTYLYQTLDPVERAYLHEQVGLALERLHKVAAGEDSLLANDTLVDKHPQMRALIVQLARHFEEAGRLPKAIAYLHQAGIWAVWLSANREAMQHLKHGLALLSRLPETQTRTRHELAMVLDLRAALLSLRGYAGDELAWVLDRARCLCEQLGDIDETFSILYASAIQYYVRGEFAKAREVGESLVGVAEVMGDDLALTSGRGFYGQLLCHLGEFQSGLAHMTRAMDLYDPEVHGAQSFHDGQDPGVANLAWQSHYLWILGYPDQALARHQASMALSESIGQPYNLCLALVLGVWLHIRRRDVAMARELDDRCIRLSREHEFGLFINGSGARGWILAQDGDVEGGIACFRDDFAADEAIGFTAYRAYSLNLLSELYLMAGWLDEGIDCADEGIAEARQTGGRHYEAETRRLKGELLLAQGDAAAAETCFRDALQLARQQAAKSWELRAAMSLARLWQQQGRRGEAYELLSGVYGWFTEGFDTPDLQEAQALLAALASGTA